MSSFNVHKRHVFDKEKPINHRFSHLRSCLNKIANSKQITRANFIEKIKAEIGVDVNENSNEVNLLKAFNYLEKNRL